MNVCICMLMNIEWHSNRPLPEMTFGKRVLTTNHLECISFVIVPKRTVYLCAIGRVGKMPVDAHHSRSEEVILVILSFIILSPGHTTGRRPPCDQNFRWSQGGCRVVARRSATGRRPVGDGCRDDLVARRFWLLQVKPLCDQIDRRKVFGGRRQVADRSPTGWQLIADQLQRLQTTPTQFLVADWSPTCRRSVADRSPKRLHTFCNQKQTLKIQSPTDRQPVADRSPTDRRVIADWSPTGRQPLSDYTTV